MCRAGGHVDIERPEALGSGFVDGLAHDLEELAARQVDRAHAVEMAGSHLAVEQGKTPGMQLSCKPDECDLAGVALARKHGFAEEHAPDRHAIEAADQRAVAPYLDRMGVAQRVQLGVCGAHFRAEPGAGVAGTNGGTVADDAIEVLVERNRIVGLGEGALEAPRDMHGAGVEYGPRIGAPPEDRFVRVVPGKDALRVRTAKARGRQVAAHGEQAVRLVEREFGIGKGAVGRIRIQPVHA